MVIAFSSQEEGSSQAVAVFGFFLVGGIGDDSQVGRRLPGVSTMASTRSFAKPFVRQLLWMSLDPCQQFIEAAHMLDLRFVSHSLKCTNEDNDVDASMGKVSNCTQQALIQLMQLGATKVFWFGSRQLCVSNDSKVVGKLDLI